MSNSKEKWGLSWPFWWKLMFFILVLLTCCHGYSSSPPLHPFMSRVTINEGQSIEITCMSKTEELVFYYPEKRKHTRTSKHMIYENELDRNATFQRPLSVFGDTGRYGCAEKRKNIKKEDYKNNPDVETIHVYINTGKEIWTLPTGKIYLGPSQNTTVFCSAYGLPKLNVPWFYTKCPETQSQDKCKIVKLESSLIEEQSLTKIYSALSTNRTTTSLMSCEDCNIYDCNSTEKNVLITDEKPSEALFGIIKPETDLYEGDNVTLVCAVVNLFTNDSTNWVINKKEQDYEFEKISIKSVRSDFTYQTILEIKNLTDKDQKTYKCQKVSIRNPSWEFYNLTLQTPEVPDITNTNLNNTKVFADVREAKDIFLYCYANGKPKPKVTWYKNNVLLESSEHYNFEDDNQVFYIKNFLESDSGNYSCQVQNRIGRVTNFLSITVKGRRNSNGNRNNFIYAQD